AVVDGAVVGDLAVGADDEAVGGRLGVVGLAGRAGFIEEDRVLHLVLGLLLDVQLLAVALLALRGGVDGQEDHALGVVLLVELVERVVVLVVHDDDRALGVEPLEDDDLALVLVEGDRLSVGVRQGEGGGHVADLGALAVGLVVVLLLVGVLLVRLRGGRFVG